MASPRIEFLFHHPPHQWTPLHIQSSIASSKLSLLLRFQICNKTSLTEELFVFTRCRYQTGRVSGHIKPKRAKPTKPHCPYPASFGGSQHPTDGHNPSWSSARGEILASRHFSMLPTHRCTELSDFPWIFPPACNIMSSPSTLDFAKSPLTLPPFFAKWKMSNASTHYLVRFWLQPYFIISYFKLVNFSHLPCFLSSFMLFAAVENDNNDSDLDLDHSGMWRVG